MGAQADAHPPACSHPAASPASSPSGNAASQAELAAVQPGDGRSTSSAAGLLWQLPAGVALEQTAFVWVGDPGAPALRQLQLEHSRAAWSVLEPSLLSDRQPGAGPDASASLGAAGGSAAAAIAAALDGSVGGADAAAASPQPAAPAGSPGNDADGGAWQHGVDATLQRTLQRRYYLVEKVHQRLSCS